jgi:AcrR family transcriptional regulator
MQKGREFFIDPDDPPSKKAILSAAFRLFVRDGFDATNIRAIGKEAGYSNPALFKFYDSKEQLGLYLFERCYLNYAAVFGSAMKSQTSFEANLTTTIDRFCEVLGNSPGTFLFVQDHLRHFWPLVSAQTRKVSILRNVQDLFEQGIAEGAVDGSLDPKMLVAAFVGLLAQYARMQYFGEFKGSAEAWKDQLTSVSRRLMIG